MNPNLFPIAGPWRGRLAIAARPRGGDWLDDDIAALGIAGVNFLVSLLTSGEVAELGLSGEAQLSKAHGIQFLSFPIADRSVPVSAQSTLEFARKLEAALQEGKTVALHCRQGIGRSALLSGCLLVLSGLSPDAAFQAVSAGRGREVPETEEQRRWLTGFAQAARSLRRAAN